MKDYMKRLKIQTANWEKIFANRVSNKELYLNYLGSS